MTDNEIRALRLLAHAGTDRGTRRGGLTDHGNALVSRHAPALLDAGLITYDNRTAYRLTSAGKAALTAAAEKSA